MDQGNQETSTSGHSHRAGDILDEDFEALQKCFDVFGEQFSAKFKDEGNEKEVKKTPRKKK